MATPTSTTTVLLSWNEPLPRNGVITSYHVSVDGTSFRDIDGNTTMIYVGDLGMYDIGLTSMSCDRACIEL